MAAIRPIPQQSIVECIPSASEIADLRILNKDLNFIQAMVNRADDLTSQTLAATDYSQLVKITDNFTKLAERAEDKTQTLKALADSSNPIAQVNSSAELYEKVQLLAKTLTDKTEELASLYKTNESSLFDTYGNSIAELSSRVDSIGSSNDVISIFPELESLLKDLDDSSRFMSNSTNSEIFLQKIEGLTQDYADKAEQYSDAFMTEMASQVGLLDQKISGLMSNIDSLSSNASLQYHLEQLSQIREQVNASASIYKNFSGARDMVYNLDNLSIATHAHAQQMSSSNEIITDLLPLVSNPEALSRAVKEAAIRTDVGTVENVLIPLINKSNELSAKVVELSARYEAGNYSDIKVRAIASFDKTVERLDRQYQSIRSTDPESLSATVNDLFNNVANSFESIRSVDPISQTEHYGALTATVSDSINTSDFTLFVNNVIAIPGDIMMSSRNCVDSAFKDFTRSFGNSIETFFDPLLSFLIMIEKLLLSTPWPIFLAVAGGLAWLGSRSIKLSIGVMAAFFMIGFLDMWDPMISTVTMISAATLLCLALGLPLGVWMSRSDRAQSWITPVLDIMQTIPSFVYLIPVVMMLGIGKVPGLIAVCIYAMPPIVRLTNLGIRLVDKEAMEAADAFGATYLQRLFMVQIPLALPNIFAGINQTIMMALAMVVIASMIGVAGLGLPVLQAVQNQFLSMGMLNGLAIVALAVIFDRVSQAFGTRIQKHRSGDVL
jgi:ABC-type proline/glycine betaine transport system permease subunit|tara:strand:+ start:1156 stop:3324 length:2169 start_codon:yes stop_codon:yes gene_type:complete